MQTATLPTEQILDNRENALFSKLVPAKGKCETFEGELLRAVSRIRYRAYNDGDFFYSGYGVETAGSSALYLMQHSVLMPGMIEMFWEAEKGKMNYDEYMEFCDKILAMVMDYIESRTEYKPNYEDSRSDYQDRAEDRWDKNDGYDYEDDYYEEEE